MVDIDLNEQVRRRRRLTDILHVILAIGILPDPVAIDVVAIAVLRMIFIHNSLLDGRARRAYIE